MKFVIFLIFTLLPTAVFANLMISPTRVNFDNRERIEEVMIINSGSEPRTYRIGWGEYKAKEEGGYIEVETPDTAVAALSPYMRISPRQVRLAPGERQTIKLQLRKKAEMSENEYRSHLLFTVLPPENDELTEQTATGEGMRMQINMLLSYSIPVLFHPEEPNVNVSLVSHSLEKRKDNSADLHITLAKREQQTSYGRLEVYSLSDNKRIGIANNVSVFRELNQAKHVVRLPGFDTLGNTTQVRLKYIGEKEHYGTTFIDEVVSLY